VDATQPLAPPEVPTIEDRETQFPPSYSDIRRMIRHGPINALERLPKEREGKA